MIDAKLVYDLRNRTGAGIVDCKNALEEAGGDMEKAIEVLKKKGAIKAAKKMSERQASEGVIATYIHHNGKLAAMLELACETDFVARNEEFKALANDLALQVAAMDPQYVSPETIPAEVIEKKKQEFLAELAEDKKPEEIKLKIIEGKLNKWYTDVCLTKQFFIKNEEQTIEQLINEKIAKIGEKIVPTRFTRMQMASGTGGA
ncbi:translation elongation factor Ts [Candidatus Uhrbacteria bacterium]|nr:translation elongation factor Ts [Candidatus Uhrbacteria bacterium]